MDSPKILFKIRSLLIFFMIALVVSGATAFPVYSELKWLLGGEGTYHGAGPDWLWKVWKGVRDTQNTYPFLFYGFDWLAFAHLIIALLFIGPYRDPVKNKWVIQWAMLACIGILPLALIAGPIRGIPWYHIVVDCCFGIFGLIPLFLLLRWTRQLENVK
ncbi:MAG: hypothetical protein J0H74_06920 [Chitinophagaceae bacterium]|nr:hypothetical protein [Chitinophagaceae bacterium]